MADLGRHVRGLRQGLIRACPCRASGPARPSRAAGLDPPGQIDHPDARMRTIGPSGRARKERSMRRGVILAMTVVVAAAAVALSAPPAGAQAKKLVYWTHWEQNPEFNKFYETRGKEFAQKTGWQVEVVTVPYQGYEAKYLAALIGKSGAPDFFMGMTHHWCGQYDFCDKMPADLAKVWDENLPKYMVSVGKWKGARYGIPIEHGNFQQMYINVDLFKKAGPGPRQAAEDARRVAGRHEEADPLDAEGRGDPGRVRPPPQGPSGGHHRQVPAVRARVRRPDAVAGPREGDRLREQPRDGGARSSSTWTSSRSTRSRAWPSPRRRTRSARSGRPRSSASRGSSAG